MVHVSEYFEQVAALCSKINLAAIEAMAIELNELRMREGRLFILGVGGSAANASHAVNDFRKLCNIEAYTPTDNISELTARTNDEGWESVFACWLEVSKLNNKDTILVFSVGGGNLEKKVSVNLIYALQSAKKQGAKILGIVGRDGGYTAEVADVSVIVPTIDHNRVTPLTEAFQAVVWHCLVSHPLLQIQKTKW